MQKEDFATHSSDLYVRKTPISEKFVKEGYEFPQNVTTFRSDDPKDAKAVFFEIPFAYQEYFQKRLSDGNSKKKERTYDEVVNLLIERGYSPYIASNPSDGISRNQ